MDSKKPKIKKEEIQDKPYSAKKCQGIPKETLDKFTENLLPGCLNMLVDMPDTVHTMYDLIVAVANRNGESWKNHVLETICKEVSS